MSTAAQQQANQANAQHSTGPQTPEGKARASRNNTKHGLSTGTLAFTPQEHARATRLEAILCEERSPVGTMVRPKPASTGSTPCSIR